MNALSDILDQVLKQAFCKKYIKPTPSAESGPKTQSTFSPPTRNTNRHAIA